MIGHRFTLSLLLLAHIPHLHALSFCPPLGPVFPPPRNVSTHSRGIAVANKLSAILDEAVATGKLSGNVFDPKTVSFSVVFSSIHDPTPKPAFEYHHAAAPSNLDPSSVSKVDGDSIYRIGSVSKTFIPYALLVEQGYEIFNKRAIDYIPELAKLASKRRSLGSSDEVSQVAWKEITVGALASHMSGIGETFAPLDLSAVFDAPVLASMGLPNLSSSEIVTCGGYQGQPPCSKDVLLHAITTRHPVHRPFTTPGYSNPGIILLAYVLESVTKKPWRVAVQDAIFSPLHLSQTSYSLPRTNGVIPANQQWWSTDLGDVASSGGIYASTNDLAAYARSILRNTLLPTATARAWLKPVSHTSNPNLSIGAPWEIRRVSLPSTVSAGRVVDLYAKDGSLLVYRSEMVLVPDFGATLAVNVAGDGAAALVKLLSELVVSEYIPVLEAIAQEQAARRFAGRYEDSSGRANSSIVIGVDSGPGLTIMSWVNEGVDVLKQTIPAIWQSELSGPPRMYTTGLQSGGGGWKGGNRTAEDSWRVIFPLEGQNDGLSIFTDACSDWGLLDVISLGNVGLDDVVFVSKEAGGPADEIVLRGFRKTLRREG